jgi:signal transduction histidine kinase
MALRKHLARGLKASPQAAIGLGRQAVTLGMETLDVARLHEQVLMKLALPGGSSGTGHKAIERANRFFAETIVPIEKTHRAARNADIRVTQLTRRLRQRTVEASASTRRLARGIAQRRVAEAALNRSGEDRARLLQESSRLQNRLRHQTRRILTVQEEQRRKTSSQLHDEIAQTLLAINLRLLTLRTSAKAKTEDLAKEIAETRWLVQQSVKTISRLAHEYGVGHET